MREIHLHVRVMARALQPAFAINQQHRLAAERDEGHVRRRAENAPTRKTYARLAVHRDKHGGRVRVSRVAARRQK
jgi:hypothetical protein